MADKSDKEAADDVAEEAHHRNSEACDGKGGINERLLDAADSLLRLRRSDFRGKLEDEFAAIMKDLTEGEGTLAAKLSLMAPDAARRLAERIWDLFADVKEAGGHPLV